MMSFWLIILFIIIDNSEALDPCYNYIAINEDARSAAVESDTTVVNATLCDQFLKEGWYRSIGPAGGEMPTSCPAVMHCSTAGPIWIDMPEADKPSANTTVTKTACASGLFSCCSTSYSIDVRNCFDEFYIYRLVPTTGCPQAYCFGTQAPCPVGQSSETGYTPGCGSYPTSNVTGTVVPGLRTRDQYEGRSNLYYEEVQFECEFTPSNIQDHVYDVFWYINDKTIPITSFLKLKKENLSSSVLLEEHWKSKHRMNMVVWCSTRVRQNDTSSPSPFFWSHGFTAGITLDKDAYDVKESESIEIGLELTVPLPCQKRSSATPSSLTDELLLSICVLELLIRVPIYQTDSTKTCNADGTSIDPDGLVFQNAKCGVYFTASDWSSRSFLNVTGKVDSLYNLESRTTAIRLNPTYFIQDSVWNYWTMPDIKVAVIDSDHLVTGKMCTSVNDPHIIPFEKLPSSHRYHFYDHFIIGEYVLFKSTRFQYQVNAMFRSCNGAATCHCGVAVRNMDGLFVINMCPQNLAYVSSTPMNRYVEKRFCDDTHMTMRQEGSAFRVTLPTGTDIVIQVGDVYIHSVVIKPSVLDYNTTVGLCGHFGFENVGEYILLNKTFTSNLKYFNEHYEVQSSDSLFAIDWQPSPSDLFASTETYCVCREESQNYPITSNYILCNLTNPSETCTSNSTEVKDVFFTECSSRRKRSIDKVEVEVLSTKEDGRRRKRETTFTYSITKFPIEQVNTKAFVEPVFYWTNGWTEVLAWAFCELSFNNSAVFDICSTYVPEIDITPFIEACVMDIKIGGDTSYAKVTLDSYKATCFIEATRMEALHKSNATGQSILHELLGTTCPNDCSGNGTCQFGECHCYSGYFGLDCNKEENSKPSVQSESMSGLCDSSSERCETTLIYGSGFNQDKVLCAFREIEVTNNGTDISNSSVIEEGQYLNEFYIQCILPVSAASNSKMASGYMISIGNGDGSGGFSDEVPFIIFDSLCYECNVTYLQCVEKSNCLTTTDWTPSTDSRTALVTGSRLVTTDTTNITGPQTNTRSSSSGSFWVTTETTATTGTQTKTQSSPPGNSGDKRRNNVEGSGEPVLIIVTVSVTVVGLSAVVLSVYLYKKNHYNRNQPAFLIKARPISAPETQLNSYINKSYEKEHSAVSAGSIKFAWNDEKAVPNSVPPMHFRLPSEKITDNFFTKDLEDITDDY